MRAPLYLWCRAAVNREVTPALRATCARVGRQMRRRRARPLNRRARRADPFPMRLRTRVVLLALVAQLATGCFVFDELDKGNQELDRHSATRNEKAKEKAAAAAKAAPGKPAEGDKKKSWWESARSLSMAEKAPSDDPHVRCRVDGKETFMVQSDCVSQGGQPQY
jgi:hypothetical protein